MSQKHSNMNLFHSAQYTNYYLPNLIQIMDFPTERRCYVTTDYSTLFPKKQASGFVFIKKYDYLINPEGGSCTHSQIEKRKGGKKVLKRLTMQPRRRIETTRVARKKAHHSQSGSQD